MVLCLLALPIFLFLGIFSIKYRKLARDSLHCMFNTVTFRKCHSGLDDRIKSQITGHLLRFSPPTARVVYKHYKIISWLVLILFVWSAYEGSVGTYNYVKYGNCNGPESTGFCLFDPSGEHTGLSEVEADVQNVTIPPELQADDPIIGSSEAVLTIIEFGCYACPYTKKAEPVVKEVLNYYEGKVNVQFKSFVIPHHDMAVPAAIAADCAAEQGKYANYHDLLFDNQENLTNYSFIQLAESLGMDINEFSECFGSDKFISELDEDTLMGVRAGVVGTPTFFINDKKIVGPKPFRTFKAVIDEELNVQAES